MAPRQKKDDAPSAGEEKKVLSLDEILQKSRAALHKDLQILEDVKFWIPSGSPRFDLVTGGGFPVGKLTTMIGEKSIGKSSLGFKALAVTQRFGGIGALEDVERSGWEKRSERIGIDLSKLLVTKPSTLDTWEYKDPEGNKEKRKGVFDIIENQMHVIRKFSPDVLITNLVDSIGGSSIAREMDADTGQAQMGAHSGVASQGFRKIMGFVEELNVCLIMINQLKERVGVIYGDKSDYLCKRPLDFWSSITVQMTRHGQWPPYDKNKPVSPEAIVTKCYISKNKLYDPFKMTDIAVFFDRGVDEVFESIEALDEAKRLGDTQGYVIFEGIKRRKTELFDEARQNSKLATALVTAAYKMVDEITGRKMENLINLTKKGALNEPAGNNKKESSEAPALSVDPALLAQAD